MTTDKVITSREAMALLEECGVRDVKEQFQFLIDVGERDVYRTSEVLAWIIDEGYVSAEQKEVGSP